MHEMRSIATNDPVAWASVSQFVTRLRCANAVERIKILIGMENLGPQERHAFLLIRQVVPLRCDRNYITIFTLLQIIWGNLLH